METKKRKIEARFRRKIKINGKILRSRIRGRHEFASDWSVFDICDYIEKEYSDLIESGWTFSFRYL